MYLSYEEYQGMGGGAEESAFLRMEAKAEAEINRLTLGRLKGETELSTNVRYCMFEMIEMLCAEQNLAAMAAGREISAVSNDGVSMSFSAGSSGARGLSARMAAIARSYLADETTACGIPLLYAGVDMR